MHTFDILFYLNICIFMSKVKVMLMHLLYMSCSVHQIISDYIEMINYKYLNIIF
jgi:hypothetical protein